MMGLNPELRRYIWLELSARRLLIVPVILFILLSPWLILPHKEFGAVTGPATWLYYALVLVWGTRMAANAVVGEIRGRTWDVQRLSSLSAWQMLWGKLIGAPILVWYAGAICLVPIVIASVARHGLVSGIIDLLYFVTIGLFAHSISLLTSLLSVRKRARQSWLDGFLFQVCGIIAGAVAAGIWNAARHVHAIKVIDWYGTGYPSAGFTFVSLVMFFLWSIIGNWRLMRRELQMRNGPWVWAAFLLFMMAYYAGFADVVNEPQWRHAIRLASAGSTAALLTYVMMFLEPKDAVHIRWLIDQLGHGRIDRVFNGLQSWMFAYAAAVIVALWLVFTLDVPSPRSVIQQLQGLGFFGWPERLAEAPILPWRALIVAALLFMTRDMALFLAFNFARRPRRADFLAVLWLAIFYLIMPGLIGGLGLSTLLPILVVVPATPAWLGPVYAGIEASALVIVALRRLFALERRSPAG
jgi:hypothetical protein